MSSRDFKGNLYKENHGEEEDLDLEDSLADSNREKESKQKVLKSRNFYDDTTSNLEIINISAYNRLYRQKHTQSIGNGNKSSFKVEILSPKNKAQNFESKVRK